METTKNELSSYESNYFHKLSIYLDTSLYFYGSIQRADYVPGKSDIDVDIFTDNLNMTFMRMQNFLGIEKPKFKKFFFNIKNTIVVGYKVSVKEPENSFKTEISIFDNKYKELVLYEHRRKINVPIYLSWLLIILKFFFYQIEILPLEYFKSIKKYLINNAFTPISEFVIVDIK
jgi:hypothetical protein